MRGCCNVRRRSVFVCSVLLSGEIFPTSAFQPPLYRGSHAQHRLRTFRVYGVPLQATSEAGAGSVDGLPVHKLFDFLPQLGRGSTVGAALTSTMPKLARQTWPALLRIWHLVDPLDMAFLMVWAFWSDRLLSAFNDQVLNRFFRRAHPKSYAKSKLRVAGTALCQAGQVTLLAYIAEIGIAFLDVLGLAVPPAAGRAVGVTSVTFWVASRVSVLKRVVLDRFLRGYGPVSKRLSPAARGRVLRHPLVLYNRVGDVALYSLAAVVVLDILKIQFGAVTKFLASFAGLTSVVVGLSLRDPLSQVLQGTSMLLLDRYRPGDKIRVGSEVGSVLSCDWLDTTLLGADNIMVRIPNADMASERIYNISRVKRSQVKQTLRFRYEDIKKMPLLLEAIREEIEKTCESLITDGSRPFRVNWTGYGEDCLTVTVNTHHKIPPMTNEYWNNRERCLEAISMAAMKTGVEFAIPRSVLVREGEEKSVRDES